MDHYSQYRLKVAATEPEHVMRKAEFDLAVNALDVRIGIIEQGRDGHPAILQAGLLVESVVTSDFLESPQPVPLHETVIASDEVATSQPLAFHVSLSSEITACDLVETPQVFPLDETVQATDDLETENLTPDQVEYEIENTVLTDEIEMPQVFPLNETTQATDCLETAKLTPEQLEYEIENTVLMDEVEMPQGKQIMESSHIQGEIEVIVEDKNGVVKSHQKVTNAITDGFLRYVFYDMMSGGSLANVLRSNIRTGFNLLSRVVPTTQGIYVLDRNIDIHYDTFQPPYVTGDLNTLDPGVVFYNVNGATTEDSQVMVPVDPRCYFDHNSRELVVEYIKNTGYGVIKSVCVGRSHQLKNQMYSVTLAETAVPNHWSATTANYLIEHHATGGTSLWKTVSTVAQYRFNLKNRTSEAFASAALNTNIVGANTTGGIVVGDHLFRVVKQTATGSNYTVRLHYVQNFRTATATAFRDIVLTTGDERAVATDTMPVMVYRSDTGQLEIFVALTSGDHDGVYGFSIRKVTVSGLNNPATMTTETVDLGVVPYCISNFGTTAALYLTGYFDGTNYYLPYTSTIDATGKIDVIADSAFQNGIVVSPNLKTVSRIFNMRNSNAGPNLIVQADKGLLQCQVNDAKIPYIFMTQVVSGTNLPQPSVKEPDDVLRILYHYKIA